MGDVGVYYIIPTFKKEQEAAIYEYERIHIALL